MRVFARALVSGRAAAARFVSRWRASRASRAVTRFAEARGNVLAGGIAYQALLSIAAGVVLGSTIGAVVVGNRPGLREAVLSFLDTAVPGAVASDGSGGLIDEASLRSSPVTGVASVAALAILLVTSTRYAGALRTATHDMLGVEARSVLVRKGVEVAAVAALAVMALVAAALQTLGSALAVSAGLPVTGLGARLGVVAATWAFDVIFVLVVYVVLGRASRPLRELAPVAAVVAAAVGLLRAGSSLLVAGAVGNPILAPFAAIVTLLVWVDVMSRLVLLGAAWIGARGPDAGRRNGDSVSFEGEHRRAVST